MPRLPTVSTTAIGLCVALSLGPAAGVASAQAASKVSRGAAVARAMRDNPQVAASRAAVAQAEARRNQASAARYPTVTMMLGAGPSLQAELVPGTALQSTRNVYGDVGLPDLTVSLAGQLEVVQPLYTFGKIGHRAEAAEHEIRAREAQAQMTRADVGVSVAALYEGMLFARDAERFLKETDHWLGRTLEDTAREIEAGTGATEQDLLRLRAARGALRLALSRASTSRRQAEAGLVAYLGLQPGTTLQPQEEILELLPGPDDDAGPMIELALQRRPELRALTEGSAAYRALAEAEAAGALPDVFAMGFMFGGYTPGRELVDTRYVQDPLNGFYPGLLVGARWQWAGPMADRRAQEQTAIARELAHTHRWARDGLSAEVKKAFEDYRRAKQDAEEADRTAGEAKRWLVQASADYSIGLGDSNNVADAAQAYLQLRIAHFDAKFRHNVALAELARATGTLSAPENAFYPTSSSSTGAP